MHMKNDNPINVIVLDNIEFYTKELVDGYLDIMKSCKNEAEIFAAVQMIVDEVRVTTLREILIKEIQFKASVLEETKN
jgi:hypothetical protein